MLTVAIIVIGGAIVFAIAAVAVGQVTSNLARTPERAVYEPEQSLDFVAEALPTDLTAELSYGDVSRVLRLFHDYLHSHGVATTAGDAVVESPAAVIDPDTATDYVLERAALVGFAISRAAVDAVIEAQLAYFEAIGAVGGPVEGPDDPGGSPKR
ncbi:MAG: hypothetical protein U5K29_08420 [Acidimicrobiales bacterium]|nr:hypothetical protein [Acidimicrobiales bacterium]